MSVNNVFGTKKKKKLVKGLEYRYTVYLSKFSLNRTSFQQNSHTNGMKSLVEHVLNNRKFCYCGEVSGSTSE